MTQQINLFEARLWPSRELIKACHLGIAAAALLAVMVLAVVYVRIDAEHQAAELAALQVRLQTEREHLAALGKEIAERRVSPALSAELAKTRALLETRQEVLKVLDSGKVGNAGGFSEIMLGFARQAQSDLWLTGFVVGAGGEDIEIRGRLLDPSRLPAYVQRLSGEPVFHGRRFATLDMRSVEPDPAAVRPAAALPGAAVVATSPRHIEFILRSPSAAPAGGAKP